MLYTLQVNGEIIDMLLWRFIGLHDNVGGVHEGDEAQLVGRRTSNLEIQGSNPV